MRATLHLCVPLRSFFLHTSERFIRARRFGGLRSRTLSPAPSPERNDRLANLYPPSDIYPYGEVPLVSTKIRRTPQSRCPSDFCVAGRGANLRTTLYQATRFFTFPFWQPLCALHPCAQVRRLAEQDAFALPHPPGHVRHPSQTHPIFIFLPLWRSSPRHDLPRHRKVGVLRIFA